MYMLRVGESYPTYHEGLSQVVGALRALGVNALRWDDIGLYASFPEGIDKVVLELDGVEVCTRAVELINRDLE
jgi:hypothetical protein